MAKRKISLSGKKSDFSSRPSQNTHTDSEDIYDTDWFSGTDDHHGTSDQLSSSSSRSRAKRPTN